MNCELENGGSEQQADVQGGGSNGDNRSTVENTDDENVEVPRVGMRFEGLLEAEEMYKRYGKAQGFGIVRWAAAKNSRKDQRRVMTWRCECCGWPPNASGKKDECRLNTEMEVGGSQIYQKSIKTRKRRSKKCGCEARVYARLTKDGFWRICIVQLEHTGHTPVPSDSRLVKEYRMQSITSNLRRRIINDSEVGVPVNQIHGSIARERDGLENMPFTARDVRDVADNAKRLKLKDGDAKALMDYLDRMRRDNKEFYYKVRVDSTGGLQDVLWVDARSRAAYEEFGDVVVFDTTYMTNDYDLPFANFVGVNHHGQTTLFGCALVGHEDIETFNWVFSQWLLCMEGKAPDSILTDQAPAMKRPIAELMPNTTHRYCIWHILSKVPHYFGALEQYDDMKEELLSAVYDSFTPPEFESNWVAVTRKYGLQGNSWLGELFDEQLLWIPAYMRDRFWAGMRTTQRVESIHRFFDNFVKSSTKLVDFGEKYIAAVETRMSQERDADDLDRRLVRGTSVGLSIERFFRDIYTDQKFKEVSLQLDRMTFSWVCKEVKIDEKTVDYVIQDCIWVYKEGCRSDFRTDEKRNYGLLYNIETNEALCDCRMFQTHGILCRHIFRLYYQKGVTVPPDCYVLDRWRKNVVRKHTLIKVCYHDPRRTVQVKRVDGMQTKFDILTDRACITRKRTLVVKKGIDKLLEEVDQMDDVDDVESIVVEDSIGDDDDDVAGVTGVKGDTGRGTPTSNGVVAGDPLCTPGVGGSRNGIAYDWGSNSNITQTVRDPPRRQKKGRPKGSRMKSEAEKAIEKSRGTRKKKKLCYSPKSSSQRSYSDRLECIPEGGTPVSKCKDQVRGRAAVQVDSEKAKRTHKRKVPCTPSKGNRGSKTHQASQTSQHPSETDSETEYRVGYTATKTRSIRKSKKLESSDESSTSATF